MMLAAPQGKTLDIKGHSKKRITSPVREYDSEESLLY